MLITRSRLPSPSFRQDTGRIPSLQLCHFFFKILIYYCYYDGGSVVLFCGFVLLPPRIGRFPSSRVCAAQNGCSQIKCLRHDSIIARGSAHTKRPVQRQLPPSLSRSGQSSPPPLPIHTSDTRRPTCHEAKHLAHPVHLHHHHRRQPRAESACLRYQTSVTPVCACACTAVQHRVVVPQTRSTRSMLLSLACLPRALLVWSLFCSHTTPGLDLVPAAI